MCYFGLALIEYSNYSNKPLNLELRHLLKGWRLLEGGAYFIVDTQRCGAYLKPGAY